MGERAQIATAAAENLERPATPLVLRSALVGFDGFVDAIIDVVGQRHAMTPDGYTRIRQISEYAARVGAAAGKSTNIELVVKEERFGGNGPLMAGAMASLGMPVTYVGAVGQEKEPRKLHPLYSEFARRCREVIPVAAPPAHTDALEFDDGKVMLGKPANVQSVTWESLVTMLGLPRLRSLVEQSSLMGIVNWVMMGGVEGIWAGLCRDVLPGLKGNERRRVYIDLADPAKRTNADILRAVECLRTINKLVPVTLGLNLSEAERLGAVVGVGVGAASGQPLSQTVLALAQGLRAVLRLDTVVIHPREGAAAAGPTGSAWFDGPFTSHPKLSTGAGDHFNGGFAFAQVHGLPLEQCLAVGCAVSGAYVRDAVSPNLTRLCDFLRKLPGSE